MDADRLNGWLEFNPRLVKSQHIHRDVHGAGRIGLFNQRLAVWITRGVGTMWAAYIFTILAVFSLPQAIYAMMHGDYLTGVAWLSQSCLQLVLLPIIIVGQRVLNAAEDARAEADHETISMLHQINVQQLKILHDQNATLEKLETMNVTVSRLSSMLVMGRPRG